MSYFTFNGVNSNDLGLIITETPFRPSWAESVDEITIPGRAEVIKNPNGEFEVAQDYGQFETNNIKTITVLKDEESQKRFSQYGDTSKGIVLIELK